MLFWMFGALVFLFIIDVIILALWESSDPLYRTLKQVRSQPEYECFQVSFTLKSDDHQKDKVVMFERIEEAVTYKTTFISWRVPIA